MNFEYFLLRVVLPVMTKIWIASIVIALFVLFVKKWRGKASLYLTWALFPFPLLHKKEKFGLLTRRLLVFFSPCTFFIFFMFFVVTYGMAQSSSGIPDSIPYHNAADLRRITGVDFPDVIPVDSFYYDDINLNEVSIKFIPRRPLKKSFFNKLEKACVNDSCCWTKNDEGYQYYIFPELPIDRPKGTHIRKVEMDGEMIDDWDGDFVSVFVPFKGDTIYVKDGWMR